MRLPSLLDHEADKGETLHKEDGISYWCPALRLFIHSLESYTELSPVQLTYFSVSLNSKKENLHLNSIFCRRENTSR